MNVWLIPEQRQAMLMLDANRATLTVDQAKRMIRLFDATVTGGSFREYLDIVRSFVDAALLIDPCRQKFVLPCRTGVGDRCECSDNLEYRFSPELCCEYACDRNNRIFLRDTQETIRTKIKLAQSVGIPSILLSEAAYQTITAPS